MTISPDEDYELPELMRRSISSLTRFVVPTYVTDRDRDRPKLLGSGFYVRSKSRVFFVSAKHVLNQLSDTNLGFHFRTPDDIVVIRGNRYQSVDELDLGFVEIFGSSPPWPEVTKEAVPFEWIQSHRPTSRGTQLVVSGFPTTKNKYNPVARGVIHSAHAYYAEALEEEKYAELGLDPNIHVALPMSLKEGYDPSGRKVVFPKPQGMSGGPIWKIYDESQQPPDYFPLVGVATDYKVSEKIVYGTDAVHLRRKLEEVI